MKALGGRQVRWRMLLVVLALLPTRQVARAAGVGGRALVQLQQQGNQQVAGEDPFLNAVQSQPLTVYQVQARANDTLTVVKMDASVRLLGSRFVPFTLEDQQVVVRALRDNLLANGPVQLVTYKEVLPDLAAPEALRLPAVPAVEFSFAFYPVVDMTTVDGDLLINTSSTYSQMSAMAYATYSAWTYSLLSQGNWTDVPTPELLCVIYNMDTIQGGFILHPVIVLAAKLAVTLASPGQAGRMTAAQASAVAQAVQAEVLDRSLGTLVEVVDYSTADSKGRQLLSLEVTLFACRDNATVVSPECEGAILSALLEQLIALADTQLTWQAAGIQSVDVINISQRQPPPAPTLGPAILASPPELRTQTQNSSLHETPWVPWHLDRIDQRSLPLDGTFSPTADGTGVNVYIISSGVKADHEEFLWWGSSKGGSRVQPAWGFLGLDPVEDCPDYIWWYGYGTYAASLCCGLRLGAAKNATIYSVRFRERCFSSPDTWGSGALPAAMDLVLSTAVRPAVVLIDTWWSPARQPDGDPALITKQIIARLDSFAKANLTVVAAAGQGMNITGTDPCSNVIASHPAVISVAASDTHDQVTASGPSNSSCIDIFAPGGGVGTGNIGASPAGAKNYTRIISRAFSSAAIMAGVAAQYLQLHPDATPDQVRRELLGIATPHAVVDTGDASPTSLLFTNFSEPKVAQPVTPPAVGEAGEMSAGAKAGIVVGSCAAAIVFLALVVVLIARSRRRQRLASVKSLGQVVGKADWELPSSEIEICKHPDGSDWLIGQGRRSKVYKALKGGVQVVAVKKLPPIDGSCDSNFAQDLAIMKYASRDANITQFYGACIEGDGMLLVSEFMEGGDLATALSQEDAGNLLWYQHGKEIMLDVVRGAHFLHAISIVHSHISSKKILLGRHRAKIGGVGVAQLLESQDSGSSRFTGSLAWAAPEVLSGSGPLDTKVDIFSIGVVLWEIVTGEVPIRGQMRSPEVPRECPQVVAGAIQACMQTDPSKRPTARELYSLLVSCTPETSTCSGLHTRGGTRTEDSRNQSAEEPQIKEGSLAKAISAKSKSSPPSKEIQQDSSRGMGMGTPISSSELALLSMDMRHIQFCTHSDGSRCQLGRGSFGSVYKVLLDGVQPMAAKMMDLGPHASAKVQENFLREAGLLWRLRHRNIVSLTAVCISDNKGYLLMELMEGDSLFSRLGVMSRSTEMRVLSWYNKGRHVALDIARGLHYLHSLKVTHFDLKSGNVLLTKEFGAKLADVGLARVMSCTHHSLSHDGSVGTFAYMAPELMAGTTCTAAVDIFSFGVLLWEICTGSHPMRGKLEALSVPQDCPQAVADLFVECTNPDPAGRPTARDLVERLSLMNLTHGIKLEASNPRASSAAQPSPQPTTQLSARVARSALPPIPASPFLAMR